MSNPQQTEQCAIENTNEGKKTQAIDDPEGLCATILLVEALVSKIRAQLIVLLISLVQNPYAI